MMLLTIIHQQLSVCHTNLIKLSPQINIHFNCDFFATMGSQIFSLTDSLGGSTVDVSS